MQVCVWERVFFCLPSLLVCVYLFLHVLANRKHLIHNVFVYMWLNSMCLCCKVDFCTSLFVYLYSDVTAVLYWFSNCSHFSQTPCPPTSTERLCVNSIYVTASCFRASRFSSVQSMNESSQFGSGSVQTVLIHNSVLHTNHPTRGRDAPEA